jgi:hypothetical protein
LTKLKPSTANAKRPSAKDLKLGETYEAVAALLPQRSSPRS